MGADVATGHIIFQIEFPFDEFDSRGGMWMAIYERHTPENTLVYKVISRQWSGIKRDFAAFDVSIAPHVSSEFDRYLRCGILQYGFLRLKCVGCAAERVIGFSCKTRGFCNPCGAKRMEQKALRLEKEVWPHGVDARQWVLTFPMQVRRWLAASSDLQRRVIRIVNDEISRFYISRTPDLDDAARSSDPAAGSITFIQRFNSALALSLHLHIIFGDGVWARRDGKVHFFPFPDLYTSDVMEVLFGIQKRLEKLLRRQGKIQGHGSDIEEVAQEELPSPFAPRKSTAFRRKGGHKVVNWDAIDRNVMTEVGYCNVTYKWMSLHANVYVAGDDRDGLVNLFRYMSRSAVSPSLLSYVNPDEPEVSSIRLALKRAWSDGSKSLEFSQVNFVERLAALVPEPWINLTRYHGVFGPGHVWRDSIVPGRRLLNRTSEMDAMRAASPDDDKMVVNMKSSGCRAPAEYSLPWAELLRRTFGVCPETCTCGAKMKLVDVITDREGIGDMMTKMGLAPMPPPLGIEAVAPGELQYLFDL